MFKVKNKSTGTTPMALFLCLYCWLLIYFKICSSISIVNFEHVIDGLNDQNWWYDKPIVGDSVLSYSILIGHINMFREILPKGKLINPFQASGPILYPLKTSEN